MKGRFLLFKYTTTGVAESFTFRDFVEQLLIYVKILAC